MRVPRREKQAANPVAIQLVACGRFVRGLVVRHTVQEFDIKVNTLAATMRHNVHAQRPEWKPGSLLHLRWQNTKRSNFAMPPEKRLIAPVWKRVKAPLQER